MSNGKSGPDPQEIDKMEKNLQSPYKAEKYASNEPSFDSIA